RRSGVSSSAPATGTRAAFAKKPSRRRPDRIAHHDPLHGRTLREPTTAQHPRDGAHVGLADVLRRTGDYPNTPAVRLWTVMSFDQRAASGAKTQISVRIGQAAAGRRPLYPVHRNRPASRRRT